nr:hypothetical protein [Tanacetum cinerariifolium]
MQKNLALIAKYFKKIYKPTNNNLRTSSNSRSKNEYGHFAKECKKSKRVKDSAYHKEKMLLCKQAEQGVPLQAEQYEWLADMDEEVQTDAGYNVFTNDLQHSEQSESVSNTCLVETDDSNVIPDSPDMCEDDIHNDQNDVESDDERQLARKDIEIKDGLKTKAYELLVVKEKHDELIKQSLLTKSHYEGLVKQKTKVITNLKLGEEHDIEKMLSMEKQLKFLNKIVYKRSQLIQTIHIMAPKVPTYNGRPTFANLRYIKQAQSEISCLYAFPYDQSTYANRLIPDEEETLALGRESRSKLNKDLVHPYDYTTLNSLYEIFKPPTQEYEIHLAHANEIRRKIFVHELKQEMHPDLKYVESLKKEIDELEFDKAEFSNMYDVILQEVVSNDVKCSYLMSLSDLDALDELQCLYLYKTKSVPKANVSESLSKPVTAQNLPQTAGKATVRNINPRVSTSTGVNHKPNVRRPHHKSNQLRDKVLPNNSQVKVKKTQVEVYPRIPSVSNKMKSVTVCKDSLNSRTLNANVVCATCNKCLVDSNHFAYVTKMLNDVNARTKKPTVMPISARKPKSQTNKSVATPHKKKVASKPTNQEPQCYFGMLYEKTSKAWKWWIKQQILSGYKWVPKMKMQWVPKSKVQWVPRAKNDHVQKRIVQLILSIVDSGCTKHMTGNLKLLCNFVEKFIDTVRFGNDQLSHLNFDYINLLSKKDIVIGLPKLKYVKDQLCSSYAHVPSQQELDLLFSPLYDEFFNGGSNPQDKQPSTNIQSTSAPSTPTNVHAEENNDNQAEEGEQLQDDEFTNPLCVPTQEEADSFSHNIGNSNVPTFNQLQVFEYRCTKEHPLEQVRGNPSRPVQTRRQIVTDPEMCMYTLIVSTAEPKDIKEAMADSAWIEAMQEELHHFGRL